MIDFDQINSEIAALVDQKLAHHLENINYPPGIGQAMRYSVFPGGKRVRPVILLATSRMFGGCDTNALPFAVALEMIHTYSMIHDDLPAMDDDDMRRWRPTNHIVHGDAMAILAGDALLNLSFEIMADHCIHDSSLHNLRAMSKIAKYAGVGGMIGGQVLDMRLEGADATADELEYIYTNKTSALFMAAFGAGALAAGNCDADGALNEVGRKLGLAFQIKDDLLDSSGCADFGKNPSDEKNQKSTYASLYGAKRAEEIFADLSTSAVQTLKTFENSDFLVALVNRLVNRTW